MPAAMAASGLSFLGPALVQLRRLAVEVLGAHVEGAGDQVAPAVGQVGVVDLLHALEGDGGVLAVGHVGHEVVAVALDAQQVDDVLRRDGVAAGLGHLLGLARLGVAHGEEAVGKDVLGQGLAQGHEHGRPDDAVEADDVLAHHVVLRGPAVGQLGARLVGVHAVAHRGHVVEKGVKPHVGHVLLVKGDLDAPVEARAADGEVREAALHEGAHLVHAEGRLDEVGALVVERQELVLEGGEPEEVGLLLDALQRTAAVRAEVLALGAALLVGLLDLVLGEVGLLRDAVPAVVAALVEVAGLPHALPEVLDRVVLARLGGADEVVVGDLELLPEVLEERRLAVAPLLRGGKAVLPGGLGDLLAVLVHAGQELDVVTDRATVAGLDVAEHGAVCGAQVGRGVDVVDGRRDEERGLVCHGYLLMTE